ncbi:uncharacterized protein PS065_016370 [Dugong dugon]
MVVRKSISGIQDIKEKSEYHPKSLYSLLGEGQEIGQRSCSAKNIHCPPRKRKDDPRSHVFSSGERPVSGALLSNLLILGLPAPAATRIRRSLYPNPRTWDFPASTIVFCSPGSYCNTRRI